MKVNLEKKILIIILFFMVLMPTITARADEIIPASDFEDEQFYQYVIENFDTNGDGALSESEAQAVTTINLNNTGGIYGSGITSIRGMEHFINLQRLDIGGHYRLTSLEPIRELTRLIDLDIDDDYAITDFSPIYGLQLQSFWAQSTNIKDISFLANMRNLVALHLVGCENIMDYSVLSELTEMITLHIEFNDSYYDISRLNNMKNLTVLSIYSAEKITDFSALVRNKNIRYMILSDTGVRDISFLEDMETLEELCIWDALEIEDFSVLGELTGLKLLSIFDCYLEDAQVLSPLTGLENLSLTSNGTKILPDMREWTSLSSLFLAMNNISESEALGKLPTQITSQENWRETIGMNVQGEEYEKKRETEDTEIEAPEKDDTEDGSNQNDGNNQNNENNTESTRVITSVSDDNIAAEGNIDSNIYLEGKKIDDTSPYEDMINEIETRKDNIEQIHVYDIWMYKNQVIAGQNVRIKVQPDGRIKVMIEIDGLEELGDIWCYVFRQETDGSLTELSCFREGNRITFYSDHFSIFTVVISRLLDEGQKGNQTTDNTTGKTESGSRPQAYPVSSQNRPQAYPASGQNGPDRADTPQGMGENNGAEYPEGYEGKYTDDHGVNKVTEEQVQDEENLWQEATQRGNESNRDNDSSNSASDGTEAKKGAENMDGVAGFAVVATVGMAIGGYDIYRRKRGERPGNLVSNMEVMEAKEE